MKYLRSLIYFLLQLRILFEFNLICLLHFPLSKNFQLMLDFFSKFLITLTKKKNGQNIY